VFKKILNYGVSERCCNKKNKWNVFYQNSSISFSHMTLIFFSSLFNNITRALLLELVWLTNYVFNFVMSDYLSRKKVRSI